MRPSRKYLLRAPGTCALSARLSAALLLLGIAMPAALWAHVKWFSDFSFADRPLTLAEAITPSVIGLLVLSMVVIGGLVWVDLRLTDIQWYRRLDRRLAALSDRSTLVLRVGAGATLLLAWQGDAIFVPELSIGAAWIGWYQFALALLLLFRRTVWIAGVGILLLYGYGFTQFGALHMLDYTFVAGVGYYFAVTRSAGEKIRATSLPALYLTVGFSLCWVALEKLIYPEWGRYVLAQNPQLALGLDIDFFLTAAAFVEFSLGYLLIICLMQRPMALLITLVFFSTTLVFGKVEVIGHTLIHAALIVFLLEGPGTFYKAPYAFHKRPSLRTAFASVNVALLFAALIVPYALLAQQAYRDHVHMSAHHRVEIPEGVASPTVELLVHRDALGGYTVEVVTENFQFAPAAAGSDHTPGEGHAHLYLNNVKLARLYGPWYHLPALKPGPQKLAVVLSANDHRLYTAFGTLVASEHHLVVP